MSLDATDYCWVIEMLENPVYYESRPSQCYVWRCYITSSKERNYGGFLPVNLPPDTLEAQVTFLRIRFEHADEKPPSTRFLSARIRNLVTEEIIPFEALGI